MSDWTLSKNKPNSKPISKYPCSTMFYIYNMPTVDIDSVCKFNWRT